MMIKFELNKHQTVRANEWMNGKLKDGAYTGAIGGRFTFSFTPTSLGEVIKVTDSITNETLDLSDYDSW